MISLPLIRLEERVNPLHTALVLIDIQNDFCSEGGFSHRTYHRLPAMSDVIPKLKDFLTKVRKTKVPIIFVLLVRDEKTNSGPFIEVMTRNNHKEFACKRGTWGAELVEGIKPQDGEILIEKNEKSAFIRTNLETILKNLGIRTLVLCGGATNICLGTTVYDGYMLGYYTVVLRDLSRGSTDYLHRATLANIDRSFGQVVSSKDILKIWNV
jgi:ureidoacrylate peracid hydrolase